MKKRGIHKKFFLSKKAQTNEIYHILIQILIAIAVYWILQSYIDSVAKDTLFEKFYLSRDIASLIDTLYGSPGYVEYEYINNRAELNKFEFNFKEQKVSINEIDFKEKLVVEEPYGEDLSSPYSGQKLYKTNRIIFSKTKNNLEISQD